MCEFINEVCPLQAAHVARETARRAQRVRQQQHQQRAPPSPQREATSITEAVRDSLTAAMLRADNASEASDADSSAVDPDSSSSSAGEDAPAQRSAVDATTQVSEAGGARGSVAEPTAQVPVLPAAAAATEEGPAPPPAAAPAAPPNGEAAAPVAARAGDEDDLMDVPFEELIGLRGPWRQLFENAATVLASTFVFLLAMLWVPFMLGSFTMAAITRASCPHCTTAPCTSTNCPRSGKQLGVACTCTSSAVWSWSGAPYDVCDESTW